MFTTLGVPIDGSGAVLEAPKSMIRRVDKVNSYAPA